MDTKIPKLTEEIFSEILKNKNDQSVEIYKKINEWSLEQLTNKNKGHIHRGTTTLKPDSKKHKYGYGTNGLIYSYTGKKGSALGKYFLFRVSVDGNFSPSLFWNTLNYSDFDKKPMNDISFREEFLQRFYNIGIDYYTLNPFEKRDVFEYPIDFLNSDEKLDEFFSIWKWVIEEIEFSIDNKKLIESLNFDKKRDNESLDLKSLKTSRNIQKRRYSKVETRHQSSAFRRGVLERYGLNGNVKCAFCDIANLNLIEAAHIIPYSNNPIYGLEVINNPKNGLCLCANHHKIFDLNQENPIVWINPNTLEIESKLEKLYLANELKITESSISNLNYLPDKGCLQWRFDKVPKT